MSSAGQLIPGRLWSLADIMKAFNAGLLAHAFKQLTFYRERASSTEFVDEEVSSEHKGEIDLTLAAAQTIAYFVKLDETKDAIDRLKFDMRSTAVVLRAADLQYALHHLLELMQSELEKRKVFAIDSDKAHFTKMMFGASPLRFLRSGKMRFPPRSPNGFLVSGQSTRFLVPTWT